jgi:TonB family protein
MKLFGLRLRLGICTIAAVLSSFLSIPRSFAAADLGHALTQSYKGKVYMIRNFWEGGTLGYDAAGQRIGSAGAGYWTTDGIVRIEKIEVRNRVLSVECRRMIVNVTSDGFDYAGRGHRGERREIAIDLGEQEATSSFLESVFSKIFVADPNTFLNSVPEYWKDCIKAAVSGSRDKRSYCRFGPHFSEMFSASDANMPSVKVVPPSLSSQSVTQSESAKVELRALRIGNGVSAPKAVYDPEPQYSHQALEAKEQGMCVLTLIVDSSGSVKNIQISRPIGYGLDEQAVNTVGTWKFEPGRRNGEPVSIYASVEIAFHLR